MNLNSKQQAVVDAPAEGVMQIIATAGSGKSTVMVHRAGKLHSTAPGRIAMFVFNNTACEDLRFKVERLLDRWVTPSVMVMTTYGQAYTLVRGNYPKLGMRSLPSVMADWKAVKQGIEAAKEYGFSLKDHEVKALLSAEAWRKSALAEDYSRIPTLTQTMDRLIRNYGPKTLVGLSQVMQDARKKSGAILFMDMLDLALELPDDVYEERFYKHLLIDEAQDLSNAQHALVSRFMKYAQSTTFVGDPAQCIYEFNSANPEVFNSIPDKYGASQYVLDINYRSKQPIIDLANKILALPELGTEMKMEANGDQPGQPVMLFKQQSDVTFWLKYLQSSGVPLSDIAILYRAKSHILPLEIILSTEGIPYTCSNGSFFEHPVVDDIMAYYRWYALQKREDWVQIAKHYKYLSNAMIEEAYTKRPDAPWEHMPSDHFKNISQKDTWLNMRRSMARLSTMILTTAPYTVAYDLVHNLLASKWRESCSGDPEAEAEHRMMVDATLAWISRFKDIEDLLMFYSKKPSSSETGIALKSIHKAKGLEWPHVGLWGAGYRRMPLNENPEEYRLLYVAVTRARDGLAVFASDRDESAGVLGSLTPNEAQELSDLYKGR